MARRTGSLAVGLVLCGIGLGWHPAARAAGDAPAPVVESVPAWAGSKAGVFVIAAGEGADLSGLADGLAGVTIGVLTDDTKPAPAGTLAVPDAGGTLAQRYGLSSGGAVALRADGTEIARFNAGAGGAKIADAIEAARRAKTGEYNLPRKSSVALQGYDPVSYFGTGAGGAGGAPKKGSASLASRYRGVTYHFADASNRAAFNADPERYVPTYGGWCATAMAEGDKVEVDPTNYKVTNGRLFLFYKGFLGNAKKDWDKDEKGLENKADAAWAKTSGERH